MYDDHDVSDHSFGASWDSFQGRVILHLMGSAADLLRPGNGVSEIMINGPDLVYAEVGGRVHLTEHTFKDNEAIQALSRAILQYSDKRLDPHVLSTEARLPDLSRVHIVQDPAARPFRPKDADQNVSMRAGICISIRRFQQDTLSMKQMISSGTMSRDAAAYLIKQVRQKANIIVSGGTSTGKSTLINILSESMRNSERIVVIEDSSELQIRCPHVLQFEVVAPDLHERGGITIRDLFKASLRMRPDRIIVGECRGGEALDMIQAMNSGHAGSLSTVHADSPARALTRLETLCLMAEVDIPLVAVRRQLGEAINVIVQLERVGNKRLIRSIGEVVETDDAPRIKTVFDRVGIDPLRKIDAKV